MKRFRMVSLLLVPGILATMPAAALHTRYLDIVNQKGDDKYLCYRSAEVRVRGSEGPPNQESSREEDPFSS
jgi:hypothetical protein